MGCLNCDCEDCKIERQIEDERVADIIAEHKKAEHLLGKCDCFYCR